MDKIKRISFLIISWLRRNQNEDVLVFQIDSVINVSKMGENKIYKAVQELKNLVSQNDLNQRNSDWPKISEKPKLVNTEHFRAGINHEIRPRLLL